MNARSLVAVYLHLAGYSQHKSDVTPEGADVKNPTIPPHAFIISTSHSLINHSLLSFISFETHLQHDHPHLFFPSIPDFLFFGTFCPTAPDISRSATVGNEITGIYIATDHIT